MQPEDPFNLQQPAAPDLPDAALPSIEPVQPNTPQFSQSPESVSSPNQPPMMPPSPQPQPAPSQPQPPQPPQAPHNLLPQQPTPDKKAANGDQGRHLLSHVGKKYFDLIEFDPEEELLAEIRKHPFGLFIILVTGTLIAFALLAGIAAIVSSGFLTSLGFGNLNAVVVFAGFLLSVFVFIITLVNAHLYRNNVVFVTNEKLAQVLFITLFNRKISQLSIGDVQDVTVQQNGFLPNTIGYGTLVVETAGEQQNYTFTFVPKPYETSKIVINAHESNLKQYGN